MQGAVLAQFPHLSSDAIAVIWTMAERHDQDSPWGPFWACLPQKLDSGLSMPEAHVDLLQGTSAHAECITAQQVRIDMPVRQKQNMILVKLTISICDCRQRQNHRIPPPGMAFVC